ncbi:hypothetical protein [Vibrio gallaecicus]|uniref:hypothetical protein n=1 Tax=Vibrio gallaecicus TaxID=552386 RepID=UPI0021C489C0|nr:hypothetical protein [Vibrio gallaecicus]
MKTYSPYKGAFIGCVLMLALIIITLVYVNGVLATALYYKAEFPLRAYLYLSIVDIVLITLVMFRIKNAVYALGLNVILQFVFPFGYGFSTLMLSFFTDFLPEFIGFFMSLKNNWLDVLLAGLLLFDSKGGGELCRTILNTLPSIKIQMGSPCNFRSVTRGANFNVRLSCVLLHKIKTIMTHQAIPNKALKLTSYAWHFCFGKCSYMSSVAVLKLIKKAF